MSLMVFNKSYDKIYDLNVCPFLEKSKVIKNCMNAKKIQTMVNAVDSEWPHRHT